MILSVLLAAAVANAPAAAAAPPKLKCRTEKQVYSRIPERVCRTESEWEQLARETEEDLRKARQKGTSGDPNAN
jgi:hypothetical protein